MAMDEKQKHKKIKQVNTPLNEKYTQEQRTIADLRSEIDKAWNSPTIKITPSEIAKNKYKDL